MANESMASGTITLNGEWTPEMMKIINDYLKVTGEWHWYIKTDGFIDDNKTADFEGNGRWAFSVNLEDLFDKDNRFNPKLYSLMKEHNSSIIFDYKDIESGNEVLTEASITLKSTGDRFDVSFDKYDEYEWTAENLNKLGYDPKEWFDYGFNECPKCGETFPDCECGYDWETICPECEYPFRMCECGYEWEELRSKT